MNEYSGTLAHLFDTLDASGIGGSSWEFVIAHGIFIGMLGSAPAFAPLLADASLWFVRRRGMAVAVCASGDLGFAAARGAAMLSLMLACGIVSCLVSGVICDSTI